MVKSSKEEKKAGDAGGSRQGTSRRPQNGGFKRADVLLATCGAVFSLPAIVVNPFPLRNPIVGEDPASIAKLAKLQEHLAEVRRELEYERRRGEVIKRNLEKTRKEYNLKPVEELTADELDDLEEKLLKLRDKIEVRLKEIEKDEPSGSS